MSDQIEPIHLHVPDADLDDLRLRLSRVRWPEGRTVSDTSQGVKECRTVIGPLTDPAAHGGDPADAFHLVLPTLEDPSRLVRASNHRQPDEPADRVHHVPNFRRHVCFMRSG